MPMVITDENNPVHHILQCLECCIILHNLLIDVGEDTVTVPDKWWGSDDNASEIGSALGEHGYVAPILPHDKEDERDQCCMNYFHTSSRSLLIIGFKQDTILVTC